MPRVPVAPSCPRAVIFDCDGVLADTEPLHLDGFNRVLVPLGITITAADYARDYLGLDDRAAFAKALTLHGMPATTTRIGELVDAKATVFAKRLATDLRIYPGVVELVRALAPLPLAVASGARRDEVTAILQAAAIADCFATIVACEDVRTGKPDPAPFLTALARLREGHAPDLAAGDCVVIEDSVHGITAARAAGMRTVAVTTSYAAAALAAADVVVPSLAGLTLAEITRRLGVGQPFISRNR